MNIMHCMKCHHEWVAMKEDDDGEERTSILLYQSHQAAVDKMKEYKRSGKLFKEWVMEMRVLIQSRKEELRDVESE